MGNSLHNKIYLGRRGWNLARSVYGVFAWLARRVWR